MGFLIKSAFWLSLVLLLVPFGTASDDHRAVGPIETFFAARGLVEDISGLCHRKPEVCEVGRDAMHTIGVRAREGARLAYGMLDADETRSPEAADEQIMTGTVPSDTIEPQEQAFPGGRHSAH
jgi:hypothetical protein